MAGIVFNRLDGMLFHAGGGGQGRCELKRGVPMSTTMVTLLEKVNPIYHFGPISAVRARQHSHWRALELLRRLPTLDRAGAKNIGG